MAENITLNSITTFSNDTTAVNAYSGNNTTITNAFTDVLSRSGTSPNQMLSNLDMNSNQVLNLPPPASPNSPARLVDVVSNPNLVLTVPPTGTSGAVVGLLNGNNTYSGTSNFTGVATFTTNPVFNAQGIVATSLVNNSIGATQLQSNGVGNAQIRQGSARTVIGVAGNATSNVADIQGAARQVLAVNAAGTALAFAQPQGDQLLGTITNDNATAGNVGELISSSVATGAGVSLSTGTATNITSISLTPGDWDVFGSVGINPAATTTVTQIIGSISATSATQNISSGNFFQHACTSFAPNQLMSYVTGFTRLSLAVTTTIFLVCTATFGTSTCAGFGAINARRVR